MFFKIITRLINKNLLIYSIFMILFINIQVNAEKIDFVKIKLDKFTKELNLNEEQQKKLLVIIDSENSERNKSEDMDNQLHEGINKIILETKIGFDEKIDNLKSFLSEEQYQKYILTKKSMIINKFMLYLIKEIDLNPFQSVQLDNNLTIIIKKMGIRKQNTTEPENMPDRGRGMDNGKGGGRGDESMGGDQRKPPQNQNGQRDNKKQNMDPKTEITTSLENVIFDLLDSNQKKIYKEKRLDIIKNLQQEISVP